jgi:hypothetical protein
MVTYNATTGFLEAHFRVGTLSSTTDTVVYLAYGDSGIATFQGNVAGTWNSNFLGVWHLSDGTTLSGTDSTSAARNGTLTNTPTAVTGQVDGGAGFASGSSNYITVPNIAALQSASTASLTAYCYRSSSSNVVRLGKTSATTGNRFGWGWESGAMYVLVEGGSANYPNFADTSTGWHHFAVTFDGTLGTASARVKAYMDGASKTLTAGGVGNPATTYFVAGTFDMGRDLDGGARYSNGSIDEVRLYSNTISADWITAEYNNLSSPSTFYTIGSEVGGAAFIAAPRPRLTWAVRRAAHY